MKKFILMSVFLLGMIINAAAIKIIVLWAEMSPDCYEFVVFVYSDENELLGAQIGKLGGGCDDPGKQEIKVLDPTMSADEFVERYGSEIDREIEESFIRYRQSKH